MHYSALGRKKNGWGAGGGQGGGPPPVLQPAAAYHHRALHAEKPQRLANEIAAAGI